MEELFNTRVLQINLKLIMTIETQWFPKGADSLDQLRRSHVRFILSKKILQGYNLRILEFFKTRSIRGLNVQTHGALALINIP